MSNILFDSVRDDLEGLGGEEQLRAWVEQAAQIEEMTRHPGWVYMVDYLIRLTTSMQTRMFEGKCSDIEEYRYLAGKIAGLRTAMDAPAQLFESVKRQQEQADTSRLLVSEP